MKKVAFTVSGVAVGYDRASARLMFTPATVTRFRALVVDAYLAAAKDDRSDYRGLVSLHVRAFGSRGDSDNIVKEVMDALKGHAYRDDCQVWRHIIEFPTRQLGPKGGVKKPKDAEPRLEVFVVFTDASTEAA